MSETQPIHQEIDPNLVGRIVVLEIDQVAEKGYVNLLERPNASSTLDQKEYGRTLDYDDKGNLIGIEFDLDTGINLADLEIPEIEINSIKEKSAASEIPVFTGSE